MFRDRLRNPGWPQEHAADDETKNVTNPDTLVLLAKRDRSVIGHLTDGFYGASAMWTAPRAYLISMHVKAECRGRRVGAQLARQKIHAGMIHAGKTATVICDNQPLPGDHRRRNGRSGARTTTSEIHRYKASATDKRLPGPTCQEGQSPHA